MTRSPIELSWTAKKYLVNLQKFWDSGRPPPPCWEKFPNNVVFFLKAYPILFAEYLSPGSESELEAKKQAEKMEKHQEKTVFSQTFF